MHAYLLAGPTAVGKTAVTQALAERLGLAILSTDSMQVYRGMDIGTAKPTVEERGDVPHFGIDLVDPDQPFNTGDYVRAVGATVPKEATVLATGGTGLYLKALALGLDELPQANPALREKLEGLQAEEGLAALTAYADKHHPGLLAKIADPENPRRVIRAIELVDAGAEIPDRHQELPRLPVCALTMERPQLVERIGRRVALMFEHGFLDEVTALREAFPTWSSTAAQAIGYKECLAVLDGEMALDAAQERIAIRTRQYAKRQFTWLNNQFDVTWIDVTQQPVEKLLAHWDAHPPLQLAGVRAP